MRTLATLSALCLITAVALAQDTRQPSPVRPRPAPQNPAAFTGPLLQGQTKLTYLVRQLGLKDEAAAKANALLEKFHSDVNRRKTELTPDRIRQISEEAAGDIAAGRTVEGEAKRQNLTEMIGNVDLERQFMTDLEAMLSPEQKAVLDASRQRLAENPSGMLTPFDVVSVARSLQLTSEQRASLESVRASFRKTVNGIANFDAMARIRTLDQFIKDVNGILTTEQQAAFKSRVEPMWTDAQVSLLQQLRMIDASTGGPNTPGAPSTAPAHPAGHVHP